MIDDQVRLSIEEVIITDVPFPFPTGDLKIISDVKGTFILWPMNLVHGSTPPEAPVPLEVVDMVKLSAKDKIVLQLVNKKFDLKSWPANKELGLENRMPILVDSDDLISLLFPK